MADPFLDVHSLAHQFWVIVGAIAACVVIGVLHILATTVRNERYLHDLRIRVNTLRRQRMERMRDVAANTSADVEVVDDVGDVDIVGDKPADRRTAA